MDFCIPVREMQEVITYLKPVISRGSDEISNLLFIHAVKDVVEFSATNTVTSIRVKVPLVGDVEKPGRVLTPAKQLISHLNTFSIWNGTSGTYDFHFLVDKNKFKVESETKYASGAISKKSLDYRFLDSDRFPTLPTYDDEPDFSIDIAEVRPIFKNILGSIDQNSQRDALRGVLMSFDDKGLTLVGTDGRQVVEYNNPDVDTPSKPMTKILDYTFAASLPTVFREAERVDFRIKQNTVMVSNSLVTLIGRVIEDEFPNYRMYFDNYQEEVELSKAEFEDNLAAAIPLLNRDDFSRFVMKFVPGKILFGAEGFINEYTLNEDCGMEDTEIHVNGDRLESCLRALQGSELKMKWFKNDQTEYLIFESPDIPSVTSLLLTLKF